jgi:Na+-transporting methylmalonyl-CoA/oxaloacetate decarboxylase gamma subunit
MGGIEGIGELVIGIAVVFFVLALVWAKVIAGLIQIVREKVWEKRSRRERPPLPTRVGW